MEMVYSDHYMLKQIKKNIMAQIKISVKGKLEMTLTKNYNSLSVFMANKDDVGFNESGNPFYDYLLNSPCGSWTGDKIKILSLPYKGRLYYNSTPLSAPTYLNVAVGQEISVRDLIDYKVLRFSAEGSTDGQYTESYLTNFTFERYCISTSQNVTVKVNLNMIDDKIIPISFVETYRNENGGSFCAPSSIQFEVSGDLTNYPLKLKFNGSPSGATVTLTKLGSGTGIIRDVATSSEFFGTTQIKDGAFNTFSTIDLIITNTGITKFELTILTSDVVKKPSNILATMNCDDFGGGVAVTTVASASLSHTSPASTIFTIGNTRTMYYEPD